MRTFVVFVLFCGCASVDEPPDGASGAADAAVDLLRGASADAAAPQPPGTVRWSVAHQLQVSFAPAISADGDIFVHGQAGVGAPPSADTLRAFNASGQPLWGHPTNPLSFPA